MSAATPDHPDDLASVDFSAVARVASRSAIRLVRLASCQVSCEDPTSIPADWADHAFIGFESRVISVSDRLPTFQTQVSLLALYLRRTDLKASGIGAIGDEEAPDVVIDVTFELTYELHENAELHDHDLGQFALANSTLHAWPYWREFGQSMSTRMGVPPLVVGTYKMPSALDPTDD